MTTHTPIPTPPTRRTFFHWLTYALGVVSAVVLSVPLVGFLFGALRKKKGKPVVLGHVKDFRIGETRLVTFENPLGQPWDGMTAHNGVYVCYLGTDKNDNHQFRVLAVNCAHLGCPVSWFPQSGLFMCPCHGGVYYETGERASGPPPRGLFACEWKVEKDGVLWIEAPHYPSLQDTLKKSADV
jgi:Rieske Fe-S protein